ncbi:T9SS type A sorting domain-containing protein [Crocinitomix catalasitica]|nr:T9SS type A sorting domain-containing protein [Crocinitomix catalasitica]
MIKHLTISAVLILVQLSLTAQYSPPAGQPGSTAIHNDSSVIVGWANQVILFDPGPEDISDSGSPDASFGIPSEATSYAEGNSIDVVSLGDGGEIVLGFNFPIQNDPGPDFAVFENGFDDFFLEFAHVEVSTDGITFVRIPSTTLVPITVQTASFGSTDTKLIHNLAGKFRQGFGTPFDLEDVVDSTGINLDSINYVKIIDVVGSVGPLYGSYDQFGIIINDPFPTAFESGGFDLDGVAVLHANGSFVVGLEEEAHIQIYPNPTNGIARISGLNLESIQLFDLTGSMIIHTVENEIDLRELSLPSGIYVIKIRTSTSSFTRKLIYSGN